jgi:hypothetical protein
MARMNHQNTCPHAKVIASLLNNHSIRETDRDSPVSTLNVSAGQFTEHIFMRSLHEVHGENALWAGRVSPSRNSGTTGRIRMKFGLDVVPLMKVVRRTDSRPVRCCTLVAKVGSIEVRICLFTMVTLGEVCLVSGKKV